MMDERESEASSSSSSSAKLSPLSPPPSRVCLCLPPSTIPSRRRNLVLSVCDFKLHQHAGGPQGAPGGPQGRVGSKLIVGRGTQLLLHGGADEAGCYSDLQAIELERAACRELLAGGFSKPSGRLGHSLVSFADSALLFGGLSEAGWGAQQVKVHSAAAAATATAAAATAAAAAGFVSQVPPPPLVAARTSWFHTPQPTNDLFSLGLDDLEWTQPETEGTPPRPRGFHAATICGDCMLISGGVADAAFTEVQDDLHLLDLKTWRWAEARREAPPEEVQQQEQQPGGLPPELQFVSRGPHPGPRYGHAMVTLSDRNRCLMFGGAEDGGTLWALDLTFSKEGDACSSSNSKGAAAAEEESSSSSSGRARAMWLQTHHTGPQSRRFGSLALMGGRRLLVFGGSSIARPSDPTGLYVLDLSACIWRRPLFEGSLCLRGQSDAVLHDKLILFGGALVQLQRQQAPRATSSDTMWRQEEHTSLSSRLLLLSVLELKEGVADGDYRFKLVTVGDSGVGKSCLLMRFVQDEFEEAHVCTIGVDFRSISTMVKGRLCTLQLWDTAGQERFSGITGNYYRNADGFVLVYDATSRDSLEHLSNWISQIRQHHALSASSVLLLVGNKTDLEEEVVVSEEEAQQFAASIGAFFVAASAKTSANVDAAFLLVATKLAEQRRAAAAAAAAGAVSSSTAAAAAAAGGSTNAVSLTATVSRAPAICSGCASWRLSQPQPGERVEMM
ncbi:hypothetical protein Esti_004418 [Eimeria stiedai]